MNENRGTESWILRVLLGLAIIMLILEAASLYVFPLPDSARYWFGDESWLMLEARTQILEGVLRHPYAFGATLYNYIGVLGNTWVTSLIYGLPAALLSGRLPIILIGRTVTFGIALLGVVAFYRAILKTTSRPALAGFATVLLVTSTSFVISAHSARTDLLVGFVVMTVVVVFSRCIEQAYTRDREWIAFGAIMTLLGLTVALHLVTLLAPLCLFVMYKKGAFRKPKFAISAMFGVLLASGLLVLIYYLTTGDLSLYGSHGQHVQFMDVTFQKPILRPFSRSVQWNNVVQRFDLLFGGASAFCIVFLLSIAKLLVDKLRGLERAGLSVQTHFTFSATLIVFLSWLLFQTSLEYYIPHFLFLFGYATMLLFDRAWLSEERGAVPQKILSPVLLIVSILVMALQIVRLNTSFETGRILRAENRRAEAKLLLDIARELEKTPGRNPLLLAESPCAIDIARSTKFRLMAPFFFAFPERDESPQATLRSYHVDYALLYSTPLAFDPSESHHTLENAITDQAVLVDTAIGTLFDKGRDYLHPDLTTKDTFKLYRMIYNSKQE